MAEHIDPSQVTIAFAGVQIVGFADGEFITIEQNANDFESVAGTDGRVATSRTNDRRATITIKLLQTSPSNDDLSTIRNAGINGPNGRHVGAFTVRDRSGRAVYRAAEAWIQKPPSVSFDRTVTTREWTLECASLNRVDGGN
jgi:hypothetical protein